MERRIDLVVTDLDNTVYDWVGFYIPSFTAMVEEIHRLSGLPLETLKAAFKRVHQRHGTTEYSFAIEELDVLRELHPQLSPAELLTKYETAVRAFRDTRSRLLRAYAGVEETLATLNRQGIVVVAHSDSMITYVSRRLRQLHLDQYFAALCAPKDHGIPTYLDESIVRKASEERVEARVERIELPPGMRKPDVKVLTPVLDRYAFPRQRVLYVGDSLSRDVLLAKRCGVVDVWAQYGHLGATAEYAELLKITYWTESEAQREEALREEISNHPPSYTIRAFPELLAICLV